MKKTAETPPGRIGDVRAANRTIAHNSDDFCLQCTKFEIASWLALNHPQEGRTSWNDARGGEDTQRTWSQQWNDGHGEEDSSLHVHEGQQWH